MNTTVRYFTKQCRHCPSVNICATFERGTSTQLSPMRCCMCDHVWEEVQFRKWVYHPESDSAVEVNTEYDLEQCLNEGCNEVSEYYATMVDLGLESEIDHEYEQQLRTQS